MRVSSLSNPRIVELISKYFVPSWVSRDDYQREPRSKDDKAELDRVDRDRHNRGFKGGTVCAFIIAPNGDVLATMPVQQAYTPANLLPFLEKAIAEQKLEPRSQEAVQASAAKPAEVKPKTEGGRFIHIWTRQDAGQNQGVSNDLVELTAAEWKAFLPPEKAKKGDSWDIPETIAFKLYQYCYPPGSQWVSKECKVHKGTLKATLTADSETEARIKLSGDMDLKYPFGKPTEGHVTAHFVGVVHADRKKQTLTSLAMVSSEKAEYVWYWQGKPQPRKVRIALELEP